MQNINARVCCNCRHWRPLQTRVADGAAVMERGQCRARPPVIMPQVDDASQDRFLGRFPLTLAEDDCGKFRRKKERKAKKTPKMKRYPLGDDD